MVVDNTLIAAIIGGFVSLVAAMVSIVFSVKAVRQVKQNQYVQAEKDASEAYGHMIEYRTQHPEVFILARQWKSGYFKYVYGEMAEDNKWIYYYTYVELCIGYCNIVLSARNRKIISEQDFIERHKKLVKLLLR